MTASAPPPFAQEGRKLALAQSCYERQLVYPGPVPNAPFVLSGDVVQSLNEPRCGRSPIDWISRLAARSGRFSRETLNDRIVLIAYGANRCLENLAWKFARAGIVGPILGVPGRIKNADVVASNIFYSGHFYGDLLFSGPHVRGVDVECVILAVSDDQFRALNVSEEVPASGRVDELAQRPGALLATFEARVRFAGEERAIEALGYVSWSTAWCPSGLDGPFAFNEIAASGRRLHAYSQGELFALACRRYLPGEAPDDMLARFASLWEDVRSGTVGDGYSVEWYKRLVEQVRADCLPYDGLPRTGVGDALEQGRLLAEQEMWSPPHTYRLSALNERR